MSNARRLDPEELKEGLKLLLDCSATVENPQVWGFSTPEQCKWFDFSSNMSIVDLMKMLRKVDPAESEIHKTAYGIIWFKLVIKPGRLVEQDWKELDAIVDRYRGSHRQALVDAYLRVIWEHVTVYHHLPKWLVTKCKEDVLTGNIGRPFDADDEYITTSKALVEKYVRVA